MHDLHSWVLAVSQTGAAAKHLIPSLWWLTGREKGEKTRIGKQGVLELTQRVAWITSVAEPRAARVALVGRGRPGHFRGPLVA